MDWNKRLSPHFALNELARTAHRYIDNTPGPAEIERLTKLCVEFLEPIRERFGPLWITSGFRCQKLNQCIGGSETSAHMYGCAADFVPIVRPPLLEIPTAEIVNWIIDESWLPFDQVIDEYSSTANWIHLGMLRPVGRQSSRRQALTMRNGKYSAFVSGT